MRDIAKFLVNELKPYKKVIIFCSSLAISAALLDMLAPIIMGKGFDLAGERQPFIFFGGAIFLWFIILIIAERIRAYITYRGNAIAVEASELYVQNSLVELMAKPLSFHYGKKSQEVSDKLGQMRWEMGDLIGGIVFDFIPAILAVCAILAYVAFLDWRIAVTLAGSIVCLVVYSAMTTPAVIKRQDAWNQAQRKKNSLAWDSLRNILIVKSTSNEAYVKKNIEKYQDELMDFVRADLKFDRKVFNLQNTIVSVGSLGVLLLAVTNFSQGIFTLGRLSAIVAYTFAIFGYVRFSQWQFRALIKMTANYRAVCKILAEPAENFRQGKHVALQGNVAFQNVRFRYREDKLMLEDVSFTVNSGERVAIVGESGEGKTTLVDLLGRYYEPQSGKILLDGIVINKINLYSLRSQMAYVPQDLTLFNETIGFNIHYGRSSATDAEVRQAAKLAHLEEFIEKLPEKYETIVGERGLKLSGGERQRVALARAFLRDPRILVLDEPTAHLDSKTEEVIRDSLHQLMQGRTTFIIAHRLRTVMDADKILVLKDGRIVQSGPHQEIVRDQNGPYAQLLQAQGGYISPVEEHLDQEATA